jgi:hypothetical protein
MNPDMIGDLITAALVVVVSAVALVVGVWAGCQVAPDPRTLTDIYDRVSPPSRGRKREDQP